jgi:hypothetical protein
MNKEDHLRLGVVPAFQVDQATIKSISSELNIRGEDLKFYFPTPLKMWEKVTKEPDKSLLIQTRRLIYQAKSLLSICQSFSPEQHESVIKDLQIRAQHSIIAAEALVGKEDPTQYLKNCLDSEDD